MLYFFNFFKFFEYYNGDKMSKSKSADNNFRRSLKTHSSNGEFSFFSTALGYARSRNIKNNLKRF